jgi:hypothetical protein
MPLLFAAALPPALPGIIGSIGSWIIPATILLAVGSALIGYLLVGALIVAASSFGPDVSVMTLVASRILTVVMLLTAMEWGRRTKDETEAEADA